MFSEQLSSTLAETALTDDHIGCESQQLAERTTGCRHVPFQSKFYIIIIISSSYIRLIAGCHIATQTYNVAMEYCTHICFSKITSESSLLQRV